jgi:hypothetical protein
MFETAITNLPPGTGFLLTETIAQKAPQREDPRAETKNRDHQTREMAEKSAFRRAGFQQRVSEDACPEIRTGTFSGGRKAGRDPEGGIGPS